MAEQTFPQQPKRHGEILEKTYHKLVKSTGSNLFKIAREMWHRGGKYKVKAASIKDRDFCDFFGAATQSQVKIGICYKEKISCLKMERLLNIYGHSCS